MHDTIDAIRADTSSGLHRRTGLDIPGAWNSKHLALRIREHYEFWARTPNMTMRKSGFWPAYVHSEKEITAYVNRDGEPETVRIMRENGQADPYEEHRRQFYYSKTPLNAFEVRIRDTIQDFLIAFRQHDEATAEFIEFDGAKSAEGYGLRDRARLWGGMSKSTFADHRQRALNACCVYLNERGKPVL